MNRISNRPLSFAETRLAEHFQCAPSQINYVLATRFTPDHGYVIESRRGGGGYIRIMRLASTSRAAASIALPAYRHVHQFGGRDENRRSSGKWKIVSPDEAKLMKAALSPQAGISAPAEYEGCTLRGNVRSMILALAKASPKRLRHPGGQGGILNC